MDYRRWPPPPGMLAAAEQDYDAARKELDGLIHAVRILLDGGLSEIDAVISTWTTLKVQHDKPIMLLMCAAAILRLAKTTPSDSAPHDEVSWLRHSGPPP